MRELDAARFSSHDNTPQSWELWYHQSCVAVILRAVQEADHLKVTVGKAALAIKDKHPTLDERKSAQVVRKTIQKTLYTAIVDSNMYPPIADRLRHKLDRWTWTPELPGVVARRLHHHLPHLGKLVAARVMASVIRTLYNGWCTARRFQQQGLCRLSCTCTGDDSLEHYARCKIGWEWISRHACFDSENPSLAGIIAD